MPTISTLYPHFSHKLVPEFQTHLTIPEDFFSKYIQGKCGKETATLKSDASDLTWQVKMTDRRLSAGWEEFTVAHGLQIGNVVRVRYEGDMVFHVSDLGPNSGEIPAPSSNNIDSTLLKKKLHPRTQVDDGDGGDKQEDNIEFPKKKRVKKNNPGNEADNSCFVAVVTSLSLRTDTLSLPQHFTSSNGLSRKCGAIVLKDDGKRSWTLNLTFNKSSDTFYIRPGWRNFCEENGENVGGFFMFKLVANGKTPVLSFGSTESISDRTQSEYSEASGRNSLSTEHSSSEEESVEEENSEDEFRETLMEIKKKSSSRKRYSEASRRKSLSTEDSSEEENSEDELRESLMEIEEKRCSLKKYSSYSPMHTRFVKFTLPPDYVTISKLNLPNQFVKENGIKPGEIYMLAKNGTKQPVNLFLDNKGTMSVGKGWKDFVKANGLEKGFILKSIWEDKAPMLSLCCADSSSDRDQEEFLKAIAEQSRPSNTDKISKDENNKESSSCERKKNHLRLRDSTPSSQKEIVTLTITPFAFRKGRLNLSRVFTRENDINFPGLIILLGKDGIRHPTSLLLDKSNEVMCLGNGWKDFVVVNGLKTGDSFTLKLTWEDTTPVLSLCPEGECLQESLPISRKKIINNKEKESSSCEREKNHLRLRDSTASSQKDIVKLTITPSSVRTHRLKLSKIFTRENDIKPGMTILLGKDGMRQQTSLLIDKSNGVMSLGKGWKDFVAANGLKTGDSFRLKLTWEGKTPVLSLCTEGECLEASAKESLPIEPSSREKIIKEEINIKEESSSWETETNDLKSKAKKRAASTSPNQSRFVTLTPTHDSLRNGRLVSSSPKTSKKESTSSEAKRSDSSSVAQNRFVTLRLTPEDIRECKFDLPSAFMRANGIKRLGKINMLGKEGLEWVGYLLTKDGNVALGCGWKDFCEANGVKTGESFTLEFVSEKDTDIVLKFWSQVERPNT